MTAAKAFQEWRRCYELLCEYEVIGYQETPVGIAIWLSNGTCIPYPYKYEGETSTLLV